MNTYLGNFAEDAVVHYMWPTNDRDGASITRATDGTIRVYKDNGASQKVTANGITDTEDFDSLTGVHVLTIDTSNDTGDSGFWTVGSNYTVVLEGATIDTSLINGVLCHFGIENRFDEVKLSATGLDEIASTAVGMVEIAKAVADRVLTGATHNIINSFGRRVRQLQIGRYTHGSVWVDTVNGSPGIDEDENGTVENPSSNIADATTIAGIKGLHRIQVAPGSSFIFAQTYNNFLFNGHGWTLGLGNQDIGGSIIMGAAISGTSLGAEAHYTGCTFGIVTLSLAHAHECSLAGTITLGTAGDYFFINSCSAVAGISAPVLDLSIGDTNVNFRHYSGGLDIRNMGQAGTDRMSLEGDGQLLVNANCVGGTIAIRGNFTLTNNGSVTISDDARIDTGQITAASAPKGIVAQ